MVEDEWLMFMWSGRVVFVEDLVNEVFIMDAVIAMAELFKT